MSNVQDLLRAQARKGTIAAMTFKMLPFLIMCALLLNACDTRAPRMTAMPSEPPEPMLDPPALYDYSPRVALTQTAAIVMDDTVDVSVQPETPTPAVTAPSASGLFYICTVDCLLTSAAARAQVDAAALGRLNGLTPSSVVRGGSVLLLPKDLGGVATAPDVTTYTVVAGDTYSRISRKFNVTITALMHLNKTSKDALQIGDVLYVPHVRR